MRQSLWVHEIPYQDPLPLAMRLDQHANLMFFDGANAPVQQSRYSTIAIDPLQLVESRAGQLFIDNCYVPGVTIFEHLERTLADYQMPREPDLPPFQGGFLGYFSYDICQQLEQLHVTHASTFPEAQFGLYDCAITFDHLTQKAFIVSHGYPYKGDKQAAQARSRGLALLDKIEKVSSWQSSTNKQPLALGHANFTEAKYCAAVEKVKNYILDGDVFEVNISQRFAQHLTDDFCPRTLYQHLRNVSHAPFSAFLNFGSYKILSASPERFAAISDGAIEVRPIKGTVARSDDPSRDRELAIQLEQSEKDKAENVMIVDLMRNDIAKVAAPESIHVSQLCGLESFTSVHHLVSVIKGRLRDDASITNFLRAGLPGGSITGAPKVRAMEIIYELEQQGRGPYCGNACLIGFNQTLDSSILIRSLMLEGKEMYYQVGGAIVLDSEPALEYQETLTKAKTIRAALAAYGVNYDFDH